MKRNVLMQKEFANKFKIPESTLEEWQKCGLIKPVGFTEDKVPLYSEVSVEKVTQIQKFQDMEQVCYQLSI